MKRFTHRNESFTCVVCGHANPPAQSTCRNHCQKCLCSVHVDKNPGDREENCGGIMRVISGEVKNGSVESLKFCCDRCGVLRQNRTCRDDSFDEILRQISPKKPR